MTMITHDEWAGSKRLLDKQYTAPAYCIYPFNECSISFTGQHVLGHHPYTNIDGADPDIQTAPEPATDIRRIKWTQKYLSVYFYQHVYIPLVYCFVSNHTHCLTLLPTVTDHLLANKFLLFICLFTPKGSFNFFKFAIVILLPPSIKSSVCAKNFTAWWWSYWSKTFAFF